MPVRGVRPRQPHLENARQHHAGAVQEQLHREQVEPVHIHRQMLDDRLIWPYAVCETPPFIADHQA